uniref:Uncharacterized protein n=1 Tax=Ananas comosus var. bracteatus TaxID=296719 RepID=A0A6V7NH49_ANACO|nr:unnamed protein product [Ananas comosus var. bracteatus]
MIIENCWTMNYACLPLCSFAHACEGHSPQAGTPELAYATYCSPVRDWVPKWIAVGSVYYHGAIRRGASWTTLSRFTRERCGGARKGRSSVDSALPPRLEIAVPRCGLA